MRLAVPQPGQVVRVRSRQYLVEEVVPPPAARDQTLVRRDQFESLVTAGLLRRVPGLPS